MSFEQILRSACSLRVGESAYFAEHSHATPAFFGAISSGPLDAAAGRMAIAIPVRAAKWLADVQAVAEQVDRGERPQTIFATLVTAGKQMESGYRSACVSGSPDEYIQRMAVVARQARTAKLSLMMLAHLGYVPIEAVRELIFEIRGLENIFTASRNTARKRRRGEIGDRRSEVRGRKGR